MSVANAGAEVEMDVEEESQSCELGHHDLIKI